MRQKQNTESLDKPLFASHQGLQLLGKLDCLTAQRRQIATIALADKPLGIQGLRRLDRFRCRRMGMDLYALLSGGRWELEQQIEFGEMIW